MNQQIILTIVCGAMFIMSFTKKDIWNSILCGGFLAGVSLTLVRNNITISVGLIAFFITSITAAAYVISSTKFTTSEKVFISITTLLIFLRAWAKITHKPFLGLLSWLCIIPIAFFVILLFSKQRKNIVESGFITIMVADCLLVAIRILNHLFEQ